MTHTDTPLAGVIGWPIAHSKSPILHGYWLKKYDMRGHYVPLPVHHSNFEEVLKTLPNMGFKGVNITMPFKQQALSLAGRVTDRATIIGAANTLTFREDGGFLADNTDGVGFLQNLKQNAPNWESKSGPALILGSGGAARAILAALIGDGVSKIYLTNRTTSRAEMLAEAFGTKIEVIDWNRRSDYVQESATIVNTSSLGMQGQSQLQLSLEKAAPETLVTDIVYNPLMTELLLDAQDKGLQVVDGLGMLLHQATPGFEAWFGHRPEVTEGLRQAVLEA